MPKRTKTENQRGGTPVKRIKQSKTFILNAVKLPETTTSGQLLVTGTGDVGQLGLGPDRLEALSPRMVERHDDIVDICAGGMHTVCLTSEGKVLTFGCNDEGALGRVTNDGDEFEAGEVKLDGKVIQISAGDSHTAALLEDGRVFAWGTFRDSHGNMGLSANGNENLPYEIIADVHIKKIASGADHLVLLSDHGEVYTCGCAEQGQLGRTSERSSSRHSRIGITSLLKPTLMFIKPSLKLRFDNIWATTYGTLCKVADKKSIYVCGLNNFHQLGLKTEGAIFTATLSPEFSKYQWLMITGGQHHTLGLTIEHECYVIGRKEYGRLGLGKDTPDATNLQLIESLKNKKVVKVACGSCTSFAATEDGELYAWGMGTSGQLGTGTEEDSEIPTLVKFGKKIGTANVFKVSSGGQHTVMLARTQKMNNNEVQT